MVVIEPTDYSFDVLGANKVFIINLNKLEKRELPGVLSKDCVRFFGSSGSFILTYYGAEDVFLKVKEILFIK
ncbi:MAG: hypothetical protein ABDH49_01145 [Candidatus Hydrothermales bacterium]